MANCIRCSGEGKTNLWRFGNPGPNAGCIYRSYNSCLESNNPKNITVSTDCLVFLNDNGGDLRTGSGSASSLFLNQYADPNQQTPIPSQYGTPGTPDFVNNTLDVDALNEQNQRIWGYDFQNNTAYYLDTVNHRGTDIAATKNKLFLGCDFRDVYPHGGSLGNNTTIPSFTINEYDYSMLNNDPDTFTKTPTKTYRFVAPDGSLLALEVANPTSNIYVNGWSSSSRIRELDGLGNDLGVVDDRTIIFSDKKGKIYVANLDNLYTGESVRYGTTIAGTIGPLGGTFPNNPTGPTDLSSISYPLPSGGGTHYGYEQALYNCSEDTNFQVYTVIAEPIIDFSVAGAKTMGDIVFIPSDSNNGGDPTVIVTIDAANVYSSSNQKRFVRFAYPTNLNNITIQNWNDRITDAKAPNGAVALFKNTTTGQFYTIAARKRYEIDFNALTYSNSLSVQLTTYDNQGFLQTLDAGGSGMEGWGVRGASQPVDCVTTTAYTYNCGIDGCVSVLGTGGNFATLNACTASCISWSCTTTCDCPDGYTYNEITENCELSTSYTTISPLFLSNAGNSSQYNNNNTYFYQKQGTDWYSVANKQGPLVATANDASGFWGSVGDYLINAPLNAYGLWNSNFQDWLPGSQENWYGTSKCITVTGNTSQAYLIGLGAAGHFRMAVNNVMEVNTTTGINNFDPSGVLLGNDPVTSPLMTEQWRTWHVFKVILEPGDNTILLEAANPSITNPAFAFDIVGPFNSTDYDTAPEYLNLTTNTYTANTVYSTKNLSQIIASDNCDPNTTPAFPLILDSTSYSTYPDPWRVSTAIDDAIDLTKVLSLGLPPGHVPGWGLISNVNQNGLGDYSSTWALNSKVTGAIPWFAAGGTYTNPITNITSLRRNINAVTNFNYLGEQWNNIQSIAFNSGLAAANPGTYMGGPGNQIEIPNYMPDLSIEMTKISTCDFPGYTHPSNPAPGTTYFQGPCCSGDALYGISGVYGPSQVTYGSKFHQSVFSSTPAWEIGPFNNEWAGPQVQEGPNGTPLTTNTMDACDGCPPGRLGYLVNFQTWEATIDWLNSEGLTVSPITDPDTGQQALIDYNADYWTVLRAVQTYWTPTTPQPAGSTMTLRTINGVATAPVSIMTSWHIACRCDSTSGVFNTQVNYCASPTIYDACTDTCVATTACTLNYTLGFSGGCVSIEGTGKTGTYLTSGACEENCFSGFTYWECGDNGCSTAANGVITPFTSQTECERICTSYSCSTTGCETYNAGGGGGTGGTFTTLLDCDVSCKSWNCTNGFQGSGCQQQVGTGGTYTELTACTATCVSYECLSYGCWGYEGTGYTYSTLGSCTAACQTQECTYSGCGLFNPPPAGTVITPGIGNPNTYYGTGTSTTPNLYTTLSACTENCASWGCSEYDLLSSARQPNIYVYYDTTSMSVDITQAIEAISAWTQSIPGYTGQTYHTLAGNERWLQWGTAPWDAFSGSSTQGNATKSFNTKAWATIQGIATYPDGTDLIYDGRPAGNNLGTVLVNGSLVNINGTGTAPTAAVNDNVIVIIFCDESHGASSASMASYVGNSNTSWSFGVTQAGNWPVDYARFKGRWTAGEANGAINQWLYYGATNIFMSTTSNVSRTARNAIAAILSGNTGNNDGLWLPGTAPQNPLVSLTPSPNYCSVIGSQGANLLETSNPFVSNNLGLLEHYGWKINYEFGPWNPSNFQSYLTAGLFNTTTVSGNSGCFSASTLPTEDFPFTSQTECNSGFTYWNGELIRCSGYRCTNTGCILVTGNTNTDWQYETYAQCTAACQSYDCTVTGCTTYNEPYFGTGGTYNSMIFCSSACTSYNCGTWQQGYGPIETWDGCISQVGTGGTFYDANHLIVGSLASYSACTGSCISYNCTGACETTGTLGAAGYTANTGTCITWPNTGGTFTTMSACTANCQTHWWCVPETIVDTCDGRVTQYDLPYYLVDPTASPGTTQQLTGTPNDPTDPTYIGNYIALAYQSSNITTLSFETFNNNPPADACIGQYGYPIIAPQSINSNYVTGGPWYVWNDFIVAAQAQGLSVNNQMTYQQITQIITNHFQIAGAGALWMEYMYCFCTSTFNNVTCTTSIFPPVVGATGPFATSGEAISNCYNTTWNCVDETFTNTCSGTTQLPGQYTGLTQVHDFVSSNLPTSNLTDISYESTEVQLLSNGCVGPNGYALYKLQPLSYTQLNGGLDYLTYSSFITALSGQGATQLVPGMLYSSVNTEITDLSGSSISLCQEPCICETNPCYCEEIIGTGGTYNSLAECNIQCDCIPTGTSWNCVNEGPYQPTCNDKPYLGEYYSQNDVIDFFRQNDPNVSFGTKRFTYTVQSFNPLVNGPVLNYNTGNPSISSLFSGSSYQWEDCYKYETPDLFYPYTYIKSISHPLISGGTGVLNNTGWSYQDWGSFYNAVVNAGININATMSFSSVCDTIDTTLASSSPAGGILQGCQIDFAYCCVDEECYCYELFVTGGTYTNEPDCLEVCCPEPRPRTGYTCDSILQTCVLAGPPIPPANYILHPTMADCLAQMPIECPPTMYDCITGATIYACDPSQPINQVSPGTIAGNGTPFIVNNPGYPFTSFTTTANQFGVLNGIGHAEQVLTNPIYLDPSVPFSSVTYEVSGTTNNPFTPPFNPDCFGPNGWPVFRMISIAHPQVNNGQPYFSWGDFVTAANTAGYPYSTSLPIQDWGWNHWIVIVEECSCLTNQCYCEPVLGIGQYFTMAECEKDCCTPRVSYDCTITGCIDPGDGSGLFFGLNALSDCINICKEYECNPQTPGTQALDTCANMDEVPYPGTGVMDIIAHIGSPSNPIYQNSPFSQMKFEIANFCHPPQNPNACYGQNGLSLVYITHIQAVITNNTYNIPPGTQFSSWMALIDGINQYCVNCTGTFTNNSQPQTTYQNSSSVDCLDGNNVCFYNIQYEVPQLLANVECCECEDDCDCYPIVGTGHTGTYPFTPQGYNLCYSACCDEQTFELCDVFLSVANKGVYQLDHFTGVITEASLIAGNQTDNDISMWIDGPNNSYLWLYNNNTIIEYGITLNPWSISFIRNISTSSFIGKGLTTYDQNTLISADNWVRKIDITPPLVNANITLMFQLPSWCLGDIIWDSISQQFLIAYSTLPVTNTSQKIGKFNYTGILQDEYTIPGGVLEPNEKIDGLYKKGGFNNNCRNFAITNKGRIFDIIDPLLGSLTLSPVPNITTSDPVNPSVQAGIDGLNTPVTGAANAEGPIFSEENCGCIRKRETYNCEQDITSNPPTTNCIDPGDGTGQFTPITASLNGYASALLECQDNCPFSCITWDCIPGGEINSCDGVQYTLPYPQVNSEGTALDYISNGNWPNSHLTPFSNIQFEFPQTTPNGCIGPNGFPLYRISYIISPWDGTHYYSWGELIDAMNVYFWISQTGFPYTWNLAHVIQYLTQYNYAAPKVITTPCICEAEPCHCVPVIGLTGQYTTESLCITDCCPIEPIEEGYDCVPTIGPAQQSTCVPCTGVNCPYTTTQALILGYPNALAYCQDNCGEITETGWKCEIPGQPCVPCPNPTPNGPCYTDPHQCYLICTEIEPNPCPPLDLNSPYYVLGHNGFCTSDWCIPTWNHQDCQCCRTDSPFSPKVRYCGPQEEVAVKISEYTGTKLNVVVSEMAVAIDDVASQITRNKQNYTTNNCNSCGGTLEKHASCLDGGCLSISKYKEDGTSEVCWTTDNETNQVSKTYDCVKGSCIEIGNGRFNTMSDCIKECNDIRDGRSSISISGDKNRILAPTLPPPTVSTKTNQNTTVIESNFYVCQSTLNPVVSQKQHACVPVATAVSGAYSNLTDCLNSGCGGWITPTTSNPINVNGVRVKEKQIAPIGMCCESYITKATGPLTQQTCSSYCCDGNEVWFPLYNAFGLNSVISSQLSYVNSEISKLVTSKTAEVSTDKGSYLRKGYQTITPYKNGSISACVGEILGYINNEAVYASIVDAVNEASTRGCTGYHEHTINGVVGYMACETHSVATARMTADGPCICREYQTQPDGSNKCIRWSPPGCGDAPFMTADEPTRMVDTPVTRANTSTGTRTSMGSSSVARGGMSSGGGGY